jgi:hypothetical protein
VLANGKRGFDFKKATLSEGLAETEKIYVESLKGKRKKKKKKQTEDRAAEKST